MQTTPLSNLHNLAKMFVLTIMVWFASACATKENVALETDLAKSDVRDVAVEMAGVRIGSIDQIIPLNGIIAPNKQVTVLSEVTGKISEIKAREGAKIRKGETLVLVNRDVIGSTYNEYKVESTIDGVIAKIHVDPGSPVGPGSPTVTIVDIKEVKAVVRIIEADLGRVALGQRADVKLEPYDRVFRGKVTFISPVLDLVSHMATLEVRLDNSHGLFRPGMSARLNLAVGRKENAMIVPRTAVVKRDGKDVIFAVRDGTAHLSKVTTGVSNLYDVEVIAGINATDQVVTSEQFILQDLTRVRAKITGQQE